MTIATLTLDLRRNLAELRRAMRKAARICPRPQAGNPPRLPPEKGGRGRQV